MAKGPGKYDDLCTQARIAAQAQGAVLIIIDGLKGHGFAVQAPIGLSLNMPKLLRTIADQIEADARGIQE